MAIGVSGNEGDLILVFRVKGSGMLVVVHAYIVPLQWIKIIQLLLVFVGSRGCMGCGFEVLTSKIHVAKTPSPPDLNRSRQ